MTCFKEGLKCRNSVLASRVKYLKEQKCSSTANTEYSLYIILTASLICSLIYLAYCFGSRLLPILILIAFIISVDVWSLGNTLINEEGGKQITPQDRVGWKRAAVQEQSNGKT